MKHDATHTIEGVLRQGFRPEDGEDIVTAPGPVHPLVRTHRETGRQALYLGRQWNGSWRSGYVQGLSRQASEALQDTLWNIVRAEQFVWYHQWRVGDYLLWDNRCVMHRREPVHSGHAAGDAPHANSRYPVTLTTSLDNPREFPGSEGMREGKPDDLE